MKYIKIIIFLLMPLFVFSCDNQESLKKQYIEACADGDFDKARNATQKLEAIDNRVAKEAIKYVNDKEIYYLLAKPSADNNARILYLYNTYEENQLPNMKDVVEVAISMGDVSLAEKLIKAGVEPTETTVKAAIDAENIDLAELMLKKKPEAIFVEEVAESIIKEFGEERFDKMMLKVIETSAKLEMNNPVLIGHLKSNSDLKNALSHRLITSINEIKKTAPTFHSQGIVNYYDDGEDYKENQMSKENKNIAEYNSKLKEVYGNALTIGSKDIANTAVNAMKPTIEFYSYSSSGDKIKGYFIAKYKCLIYHNYDEINKLKAELK